MKKKTLETNDDLDVPFKADRNLAELESSPDQVHHGAGRLECSTQVDGSDKETGIEDRGWLAGSHPIAVRDTSRPGTESTMPGERVVRGTTEGRMGPGRRRVVKRK